jgi:hypothetical protein
MRLAMVRDRFVGTTQLGRALLDAIYCDYYSFSPPIADELAGDAELREQVLRTCVRPLLAWYGLTEVLALNPGERRAAERAAEAVLSACQANTDPATTLTLLEATLGGNSVPDDAPELFGYLASRLRGAVALPYAAWAIFTPLVLAWTCAATGADVIDQASTWLGEAPLERLPPPAVDERLDVEFRLLAQGPFEARPLREKVGARMLAAWPHLAEDLRRHGFRSADDVM